MKERTEAQCLGKDMKKKTPFGTCLDRLSRHLGASVVLSLEDSSGREALLSITLRYLRMPCGTPDAQAWRKAYRR